MSCFRLLPFALALFIATAAEAEEFVTPPDRFVTTHHEIDVGGQTLSYTAHAGLLPLYENDTGTLMARIFVMAYVADRPADEPARPLTFIWNGGPGASSSQLQLMGFGPKGFETPATYPEWTPDQLKVIGDRPESWLTISDLVFVDPVGTGYSRATSQEYRDILYTTRGDIEAVAEAIRLYRTRFDAWDAPLFIAGESYGTTRAMGVAEALERRRAGLAGVILMSGEYDAGQSISQAMQSAMRIPLYTAAAHYHKRLPADLQAMSEEDAANAAERWARDEYAPALDRRDDLSPDEESAIVAGIERFTGVASEFVDTETLSLPGNTFSDRLLDDQDLELGHYDYRMTKPRRDLRIGWSPVTDPSLSPMLDLMQGTSAPAIRYLRDTLGYKSDLLYRGPFGGAFHPRPFTEVTQGAFGEYGGVYSDWMTVMWNRGALAAQQSGDESPESTSPERPQKPPLQRAMEMNRKLLVWVVTGRYDISCALHDEEVARTPAELNDRVRASCYDAGHMLYTDIPVRRELQRDFARFVKDARAARAGE